MSASPSRREDSIAVLQAEFDAVGYAVARSAPRASDGTRKALRAHCIEVLGLREDRLNVEFAQHTGDEMYHPTLGGYSPKWKPGETP